VQAIERVGRLAPRTPRDHGRHGHDKPTLNRESAIRNLSAPPWGG
jgi:hypothetical protein